MNGYELLKVLLPVIIVLVGILILFFNITRIEKCFKKLKRSKRYKVCRINYGSDFYSPYFKSSDVVILDTLSGDMLIPTIRISERERIEYKINIKEL